MHFIMIIIPSFISLSSRGMLSFHMHAVTTDSSVHASAMLATVKRAAWIGCWVFLMLPEAKNAYISVGFMHDMWYSIAVTINVLGELTFCSESGLDRNLFSFCSWERPCNCHWLLKFLEKGHNAFLTSSLSRSRVFAHVFSCLQCTISVEWMRIILLHLASFLKSQNCRSM